MFEYAKKEARQQGIQEGRQQGIREAINKIVAMGKLTQREAEKMILGA